MTSVLIFVSLLPSNPRHTNIIRTTSITYQERLARRIPSWMCMALVIKIELRATEGALRWDGRGPDRSVDVSIDHGEKGTVPVGK